MVHVRPPLSDFITPTVFATNEVECNPSPVRIKIWLEFFGFIGISEPRRLEIPPLRIAGQPLPMFNFRNPPVGVPQYTMLGLVGSKFMHITRPVPPSI
jgi:hypothetical protein